MTIYIAQWIEYNPHPVPRRYANGSLARVKKKVVELIKASSTVVLEINTEEGITKHIINTQEQVIALINSLQ